MKTIKSRIYLGNGKEVIHYNDGTAKATGGCNIQKWLDKNLRKSYCDNGNEPHLHLNYEHEETF